MIEILTNPWVVGLGVTVLGGLILHYVFGIGKEKVAPSGLYFSKEKESTKEPKINDYNSKPTPREIMNYLQTLPPLQIEDAQEKYKGILVSWTVNVKSSEKLENDKVRLTMQYNGSFYPAIVSDIKISDYPKLNILAKNQKFAVEGKIRKVLADGAIFLESSKLFIK